MVCQVEQNHNNEIKTMRKSNDYWRIIHTHNIFINFPPNIWLHSVLLVPNIIQIYLKLCFSAPNLFFPLSTKLWKKIFCCSAMPQQCMCLHCLQAPLCLSREQQPILERREGGLRRHHINVTPRHWCDFSILWAHTS